MSRHHQRPHCRDVAGIRLHGHRNTAILQSVSDQSNAIFESCSLPDLTRQPIRRTIEHLQSVANILDGLIPDPSLAQAAIDAPADA